MTSGRSGSIEPRDGEEVGVAADRGRSAAALSGALAAVMAVAVTELAAALLPGARSPFVAVGDAVIESTPGPIVRVAIATFGGANRLVLLTSMAVVVAALGAVIGVLATRRRSVAPFGFAAFAALGMAAGVADPLLPVSTALLAPVVGAAAGIATLGWLLGVASRPSRSAAPPAAGSAAPPAAGSAAPAQAAGPAATPASRRSFLGWALATAAVATTFAATGRFLQARARQLAATSAVALPPPPDPLPVPAAGASLDVAGLSPLITPNDAFYRIDTAFTVPRIEPSTHSVRFTGLVDRPFEITYGELLELADTEVDVTLSCVSNEVGGDLVGNARWRGVPLAELLDRAGVQAGATQIVGRSVDGWTGGFPVEAAFDGRPAIVAVGMNGEPLPARHGFPARLVIAGLYGYVSDTKWLSEVELTTFDAYDAYWIQRGWAERGPIKTQSRIDVPAAGATVATGTVAVAGVAWAGERGISAVEVSVDGGPWQRTELADELAATSWRQWLLRWDAEPGGHTLRVRAVDGDGQAQTAEIAPPAPDGATGHHTIRVTAA
jgi:DMSO/TMAO reductase YedYZ molybdopterin-dependent catalytic subunit